MKIFIFLLKILKKLELNKFFFKIRLYLKHGNEIHGMFTAEFPLKFIKTTPKTQKAILLKHANGKKTIKIGF